MSDPRQRPEPPEHPSETGQPDDLDALLFDWQEGTLDEAGTDRLRERLRRDPAARARYVSLQLLTLALESGPEADAAIGEADDAEHETDTEKDTATAATPPADPQVTTTSTIPRSAAGRRPHWWVALAIALGLLAAVRWLFLETRPRPDVPPDAFAREGSRESGSEATATGVALVTRLVDVEWPQAENALVEGDAVPPGRLAIAAGLAQIEFFNGATVVLEGPAELQVESATSARFLAGRLRAKVPPAARGFEIHVEGMTVVDLGTEFGLDITPDGADVQVFDGEVELRRNDDSIERVRGGRAVRHTPTGLAETELAPERFVDIASLEQRDRERTRAGFERWKRASETLRADPRLITYYAFDTFQPWERTLPNSTRPRNGELDGAIVGANHVLGRWGAKGALEFKRPGDRVKVQIPGEYGSLTLACWVRIDSLDRWYNSLFLTDHYEPGEPHWQILDSGQLFFSVRRKSPGEKGKPHQPVLSKPFWKPSMSGRWLHLATTYDAETGRVTHYLDGEPLGTEVLPEALRVTTTRIGTASLGNWSAPTKPDAEFAIRNLNGRIDEFALFAAALGHDEIREMYDHGKP